MLKILLLEDNKDDVVLIERVLKKDSLFFESECVDTREEFCHSILEFKPDVILSDHGLPQFNSMEALKICKSENLSIPFILVTGTVSEEFAITCLHQGADDYILKSNLSRLPSAIRKALRQRQLELLRKDARKELRTQNRELSKVNKELDNFVYSVSHNLRAPLVSVTGLLHLAKLEDKEGHLTQLHAMMEHSISKLDDTLKEIINYSKNVRDSLHYEEIDWQKLIEESLAKLHYLEKEGSFVKTVEVLNPSPFYSDKSRLGVIFQNLLSNSILYQDVKRPLCVSVTIDMQEDNAIITVKDNGIGIEESIQPRVFDMFYRGTELSHGAGLGLYIAKEMATKLKGKISLSSVPKEGTIFRISLPNQKFSSL